MGTHIGRNLARTGEDLELSKLDQKSLRVYSFMLKKIGYQSSPLPIALTYICLGTGLTINQVRLRIKKLLIAHLIQKWTVSNPDHYKKTYYRIVYHGDKRKLYKNAHKKNQKKIGNSN